VWWKFLEIREILGVNKAGIIGIDGISRRINSNTSPCGEPTFTTAALEAVTTHNATVSNQHLPTL
jgi:hypothetical protein